MGIYDRDYTHEGHGGGGRPQMRLMMPSVTPVVKWLLIINTAVYIPCYMIPTLNLSVTKWFSVLPANLFMALQPWRIITYQFLHGPILHILFNMLVLFFFGPLVERLWGSKKFLIFYLTCGAMGGILFSILVITNVLGAAPLVGASGAIYGMLAAGAVLFPNLRVYVLGIFPMTLRALAFVVAAISILKFFGGENAGGEAAHLAGMVAGITYVLWRPWVETKRLQQKKGAWQRKMQFEREFQTEVDRILEKVHQSGINSLTRKEKAILKEATQREQNSNR